MPQGILVLIQRSARFGAIVAVSSLALATAAVLAVADGALSSRAAVSSVTTAQATTAAPEPFAAFLSMPIGGDERAICEGEPALESTVEPTPPVAAAAAVQRVPTAVPTAAPVVAASPEPRVTASRATLYDAMAAAFPEQADRAYGIVQCESSGKAHANTGNGYYGLWQFDLSTWQSVGGAGLPSDASIEEQVGRARALYDRRGWSPWECAY